jgi:hypothetical protein
VIVGENIRARKQSREIISRFDDIIAVVGEEREVVVVGM